MVINVIMVFIVSMVIIMVLERVDKFIVQKQILSNKLQRSGNCIRHRNYQRTHRTQGLLLQCSGRASVAFDRSKIRQSTYISW